MTQQFHTLRTEKCVLCLGKDIHKNGHSIVIQKSNKLVWPVWLSGLGIILQTKLPVQFLVRAQTWVVGQVSAGSVQEATNRCFSYSLSPSLPISLKINK